MAALFPDEYLHIGGDENEGKQWDRNPAIQAYMKQKGIKDNHALQAYFNTRLLKILQKHGKKMIGWDEILQPESSERRRDPFVARHRRARRSREERVTTEFSPTAITSI